MTVEKYLVITKTKSRYGYSSPKIEMREREPKLSFDQISLRLILNIPNALFERPRLEARLTVPEEAVSEIIITPEMTDNMEQIIKDATGISMSIKLEEHPKPEVIDPES